MAEPKLAIELIPGPTMGLNARAVLTAGEWDKVRKFVYERAGYRCEVCGDRGLHHPVEAHEQWDFDDEAGVQRLTGIVALCPDCHKTKHYGLSQRIGTASASARQLRIVNGWGTDQVAAHIRDSFSLWAKRSQTLWRVDMAPLGELLRQIDPAGGEFFREDP